MCSPSHVLSDWCRLLVVRNMCVFSLRAYRQFCGQFDSKGFIYVFEIRLFIHSVNDGFTCVIFSLIESLLFIHFVMECECVFGHQHHSNA